MGSIPSAGYFDNRCQGMTASDRRCLYSAGSKTWGVFKTVFRPVRFENATDSCTGNQAVRARGDLRAGFVKEIEVRVLALP